MVDLYKLILDLCEQKGVSGGKMCADIGVSRSFMTELKKGRAKTVTFATAQKLADYFNVSVDYFDTEKEKTPDAVAPREEKYNEIFNLFYNLSEENMKLALKGLDYLIKIPDEKLPEAVRYLQFLSESGEN